MEGRHSKVLDGRATRSLEINVSNLNSYPLNKVDGKTYTQK